MLKLPITFYLDKLFPYSSLRQVFIDGLIFYTLQIQKLHLFKCECQVANYLNFWIRGRIRVSFLEKTGHPGWWGTCWVPCTIFTQRSVPLLVSVSVFNYEWPYHCKKEEQRVSSREKEKLSEISGNRKSQNGDNLTEWVINWQRVRNNLTEREKSVFDRESERQTDR